MKKINLYFFALFIFTVSLALMFSACNNSNYIDTNESANHTNSISNENSSAPDNISDTSITNPTNTVSSFGNWSCFVAPDPEEDPDNVEYYESYDCTPGYLYFKKSVYGEVKPLFEKHLKTEDFVEIKNKVYVITDDDELVRVNKEDCSYETIYKAQYGSIDIKVIGREEPDSKYLYFDDGNYIVRLNTSNEKCEIVTKSDNGISKIYGGGEGSFDDAEGCFFCNICGDSEEFFVWADKDENFYWYHPETGKNEKVEEGNLYFGHIIDAYYPD